MSSSREKSLAAKYAMRIFHSNGYTNLTTHKNKKVIY